MNESDQLHCALIDTGLQISIVRKSVWNELPDDYKRNHILESNCNTVIKGFGTKSNIIDFIGQIDLIFENEIVIKDIPVTVVSDEVLPVCIILGLNFIITNNIVFDYSRSVICLDCQVYIPMRNFCITRNNQMCHIMYYQGDNESIVDLSNDEMLTELLLLLDKDQIIDLQKRNHVIRQVKQWLLKTGYKLSKTAKR